MLQTYCHPYKGGAVGDWAHGGTEDEGENVDFVQRETKILQCLEAMTKQPELEQRLHLEYILKKNANTEYLRKHGMNGATDVDTFRRCMPVVDYEAFRDSIERITNGDKSPILSADPPVEVLVSSGTTGGNHKIFPVNGEDLGFRGLTWSFSNPTLSRAMPSLRKGKFLLLHFSRGGSQTLSGLPTSTKSTSFASSTGYKERSFHPIYNLSSPNAVSATFDTNSAMYGHLLCGLLQRHEITRIGSLSSAVVVKAMRALEMWWPEICQDIATGTVNEIVQDQNVREAVLHLLLEKGPEWRAELARSIRKECLSEEGLFKQDGIIPRLWPNCEVIDTGGTGLMKQYLPAIAHYSNNMQVACTPMYAATEGFFGINVNPSLPPEETFYVLTPAVAYYEFIAAGASKRSSSEDEVLDLASLEVGQQYEILVTTISGYCRLRIGDILEVVGSYNNSPLFKFVRRTNVLLSVDLDQTDEVELHAAVSKAALSFEKELPGVRLYDYTSFVELGAPGHYVIVWELCSTLSSTPADITSSLLERCCTALEASLSFTYRKGRSEGKIGPLELIIVLPGTFDLLCEYAFNRGASLIQYKVPRGLSPEQAPLRDIIKGRVTQRYFSSTKSQFLPASKAGPPPRNYQRESYTKVFQFPETHVYSGSIHNAVSVR